MARVSTKSNWLRMSDEELLDVRICDLALSIEGTPLEQRVKRLYLELDKRWIGFKPHVWLSNEWFSPDGIPGFAIPFYLAHPRLIKLERRQMLEVEGGTDVECMRLLRHEAGHALDTAYRLHFKRRWHEVFGSFARPYPDSYKPKPNSRKYVLHLQAWYAQAHPAEDFAETFAVWLTPGSRWRGRYRGWPALRKLEYVDQLMKELVGIRPKNRRRRKVETLPDIRTTLREYYRRKRQHYSLEWPAFYDRDLRRIFSWEPHRVKHRTAASFLRTVRREVCQVVADGTGIHQYAIDHVFQNMMERCKELKLRVTLPETQAKQQLMIMLTVQTMNIVHSGYHHIAV